MSEPKPDFVGTPALDQLTQIGRMAVDPELEQPNYTPRQIELFEECLPEVPRIVHSLLRRAGFHEIEEATSDGFVGLLKGIRKFDPEKLTENDPTGTYFVTQTIRGEILKGRRKRLGRHEEEIKDDDGNITEKIDRTAKNKPSVMHGAATSLSEPLGEDGETTLLDFIPDDAPPEREYGFDLLWEDVQTALGGHSERDQEIFYRSVFLGQTQQEIGDAVSLSQMHISRLLRKMQAVVVEKLDLRPPSNKSG